MSTLLCSFCGRAQDQVDKLIAGPGVYICNECVDLCRAILDEDSGSSVPDPSPDALAPSAAAARIPVQLVERANRIARAERRLARELGREPTAGEIAAASGIGPDELESIRRSIAPLTQP